MGKIVLQKKVIANKTERQTEGDGTNHKGQDPTKSRQHLGVALIQKRNSFQMGGKIYLYLATISNKSNEGFIQ